MRGAETGSGSATAGSSSRETENRPMNLPSLLEEEDNPPAHWPAELRQSRREVRGFVGVIWEGSPPMLAQGRQHAPCAAHLGSSALPAAVHRTLTGLPSSMPCPAPLPALPIANAATGSKEACGWLIQPLAEVHPTVVTHCSP